MEIVALTLLAGGLIVAILGTGQSIRRKLRSSVAPPAADQPDSSAPAESSTADA